MLRTPQLKRDGTDAPSAGFGELKTIIQLMNGAWVQQALYVAAKLGVADALAEGPLPVAELAETVGAHTEALYRYLRALVSVGVFDEVAPRVFGLNSTARYLRSDQPGSHRWIVVEHGEETYRAFAESLHTATTGQPAFDRVFGSPFFAWLAAHPERRSGFNQAMAANNDVPAVAARLDLDGTKRVVDVGGGQGRLIGTMLERAPAAAGVLFDLPEAVVDAPAVLAEYRVADRVEIVGGDMFAGVPAGADLYTLCRILHDFDDVRVAAVLDNIRAAARPGARVAVLDALLPQRSGYNPAVIADLIMMTIHGGRFYTEAELTGLLDDAGFEVEQVVPADSADPRAESLITARVR